MKLFTATCVLSSALFLASCGGGDGGKAVEAVQNQEQMPEVGRGDVEKRVAELDAKPYKIVSVRTYEDGCVITKEEVHVKLINELRQRVEYSNKELTKLEGDCKEHMIDADSENLVRVENGWRARDTIKSLKVENNLIATFKYTLDSDNERVLNLKTNVITINGTEFAHKLFETRTVLELDKEALKKELQNITVHTSDVSSSTYDPTYNQNVIELFKLTF